MRTVASRVGGGQRAVPPTIRVTRPRVRRHARVQATGPARGPLQRPATCAYRSTGRVGSPRRPRCVGSAARVTGRGRTGRTEVERDATRTATARPRTSVLEAARDRTCSSTATTSCSTSTRSRGLPTGRRARRDELPRRVHLLRLERARDEPPGADRPRRSRRRSVGRRTHKPSNSDVYTPELARFVTTFERVLGVAAPAVPVPDRGRRARGRERAEGRLRLEVARTTSAHGRDPALGTRVLHLTGRLPRPQRLHPQPHQHRPGQDRALPDLRLAADPDAGAALPGRAGRTRRRRGRGARAPPATRSPPPRTTSPARSSNRSRGRAATTTSPSGSSPSCRHLTHEHDALFVCDEVQTGVGMTGTRWAFQQLGLRPGPGRLRQEDPRVRRHGRRTARRDRRPRLEGRSSRINSTFGAGWSTSSVPRSCSRPSSATGSIARAATARRSTCSAASQGLAERHEVVTQPRGRGLFAAIDLPDAATRDAVVGPPVRRGAGHPARVAAPRRSGSVRR